MNLIGVMQGRLSPPVNGKIQAFPKGSWDREFVLARECAFDLIEWIFEAEDWQDNPIFSNAQSVTELANRHKVGIHSLCADYFMEKPLIRASSSDRDDRVKLFKDLIVKASEIGIKYIEVPFVDHSAIQNGREIDEAADAIRQCLPAAEKYGIYLALETSLNPEEFLRFIQKLNHPNIKVNYDIGNSASLGYATVEEIEAYGKWIATVHVKDRVRGGKTVPLGLGNADFDATFRALSRISYQGPFIFQAARNGNEVDTHKKYMAFLQTYLEKYFKGFESCKLSF